MTVKVYCTNGNTYSYKKVKCVKVENHYIAIFGKDGYVKRYNHNFVRNYIEIESPS